MKKYLALLVTISGVVELYGAEKTIIERAEEHTALTNPLKLPVKGRAEGYQSDHDFDSGQTTSDEDLAAKEIIVDEKEAAVAQSLANIFASLQSEDGNGSTKLGSMHAVDLVSMGMGIVPASGRSMVAWMAGETLGTVQKTCALGSKVAAVCNWIAREPAELHEFLEFFEEIDLTVDELHEAFDKAVPHDEDEGIFDKLILDAYEGNRIKDTKDTKDTLVHLATAQKALVDTAKDLIILRKGLCGARAELGALLELLLVAQKALTDAQDTFARAQKEADSDVRLRYYRLTKKQQEKLSQAEKDLTALLAKGGSALTEQQHRAIGDVQLLISDVQGALKRAIFNDSSYGQKELQEGLVEAASDLLSAAEPAVSALRKELVGYEVTLAGLLALAGAIRQELSDLRKAFMQVKKELGVQRPLDREYYPLAEAQKRVASVKKALVAFYKRMIIVLAPSQAACVAFLHTSLAALLQGQAEKQKKLFDGEERIPKEWFVLAPHEESLKTLQSSLMSLEEAVIKAAQAETQRQTTFTVLSYVKRNRELLKKIDGRGYGLVDRAAFGYINGNKGAWGLLIELLKLGGRRSIAFARYLEAGITDTKKEANYGQICHVINLSEEAAQSPIEEIPDYPEDPSRIPGKKSSGLWGYLGW